MPWILFLYLSDNHWITGVYQRNTNVSRELNWNKKNTGHSCRDNKGTWTQVTKNNVSKLVIFLVTTMKKFTKRILRVVYDNAKVISIILRPNWINNWKAFDNSSKLFKIVFRPT